MSVTNFYGVRQKQWHEVRHDSALGIDFRGDINLTVGEYVKEFRYFK